MEEHLQAAIMSRVNVRGMENPLWKRIYHVPNGGARDKRTGASLKRQGVRRGVPDLCWPIARHGYHGLYMELKAGSNDATPEQTDWLQFLANEGYCCCIVRNDVEEAIRIFDWYESGE